ncbi:MULTISPECIES: UPF0262 family protein [Hyphomonas]|jgi:uncharacterized protein (UPF0262 family)|uniref:UPF0262 protein HJA_05197 n=1 Tax=Hyphomonas jannaschiana VP2 TaxID=1280952 RepID=A0A059FGG4_9PROT|nr:UPF0262 family protein [Hyphomonas jannaschiana]KCZ89621.1 hypothetical protein HJA_05197 [Hyphomonas jannaschiana VP2]
MSDKNRLIAVEIDEDTLGASGPDAEHERRVAIFDLIEQNSFALPEHGEGPFILALSKVERRLVFAVRDEHGKDVHTFILSLNPFRGVIRDYFMICDSYYDAIRTQSPHQIEAIDMARRGVHNEGSELLAERLQGKVEVDFLTARRLFTLICALHAGQARAAG